MISARSSPPASAMLKALRAGVGRDMFLVIISARSSVGRAAPF